MRLVMFIKQICYVIGPRLWGPALWEGKYQEFLIFQAEDFL